MQNVQKCQLRRSVLFLGKANAFRVIILTSLHLHCWSCGRNWEDCSQQRVGELLPEWLFLEMWINAALRDQDGEGKERKGKWNQEDAEVAEEADNANVHGKGKE